MDKKKLLAALSASVIAVTLSGCGGKSSSSKKKSSSQAVSENVTSGNDKTPATEEVSEAETTEPVSKHISPIESVSATCGSQYTASTTIQRTEGSNTLKVPLAEFIEDGDEIQSFTFVIYSDSGNIGTYKGGCGISVSEDCPAATDKGWFQSPDFSAPTQGTYGEIKWDVPQDIRKYISAGGDIMFGYWWGNTDSIRVEEIVCTYNRKRELPVDGTVTIKTDKSVDYSAADNTIRVSTDGQLPENAVPEAVIYNISSGGAFRKFTGAFGYSSSAGSYMSGDTAVFTDSSSLELTWFVPDDAKCYTAGDGEIVLGYWWSEQPSVKLDSVTVKYSQGDGTLPSAPAEKIPEPTQAEDYISINGFRSAAEISKEIKVGWNLGNTLECYGYKSWSEDAETAWGNPVTTKEMIKKIKDAGFNTVRIPVTWAEHMNGDVIDSSWMSRVKEVVDYAYDEDLFVILNMHHDDFIWFTPSEAEYESDSAKLKTIWRQISAEFGDYGDRLLFEGMNEPRTIDSPNEWMGGTPEERKVVNKYIKDFVDTVRETGGKNADRTLIVTSYAASAETSAINDVVIPNGGNIAISVHYYAPWEFAEGKNTTFGDSEKKILDAKFSELRTKFVDKGVPVFVGEFGCVAAADNSTRAQFYEYYVSAAKKSGIKCFVWDNGIESGDSSYGLFNRAKLTFNNEIITAIIKGSK